MSYQQSVQQGAAGLPPGGMPHGDGSIWQPQYIHPGQNYPPYQYHQIRNNPQHNVYVMPRMPVQQTEMGLMGPPPIPQKPVAIQQSHLINRPPGVQLPGQMMSMNPSFHADLMRNKGMSIDSMSSQTVRPHFNQLNDPYRKPASMAQNQAIPVNHKLGWPQPSAGINNIGSLQLQQPSHSVLPIVSSDIMEISHKSSEGNLLGDTEVELDSKVLEYFNTSSIGSSSGSVEINQPWSVENKPAHKQDKPTPTQSPNLGLAPNASSDLITNQQPSFQTGMSQHPAMVNSQTHNQPINGSSISFNGGFAHLDAVSKPVESSLTEQPKPSSKSSADKEKPKRRRRKRCGDCEPCLLKEDCGQCYVCRNKGQVNAICKARKCLILRKKPPGSDSSSSDGSYFSQTDTQMRPVSNNIPTLSSCPSPSGSSNGQGMQVGSFTNETALSLGTATPTVPSVPRQSNCLGNSGQQSVPSSQPLPQSMQSSCLPFNKDIQSENSKKISKQEHVPEHSEATLSTIPLHSLQHSQVKDSLSHFLQHARGQQTIQPASMQGSYQMGPAQKVPSDKPAKMPLLKPAHNYHTDKLDTLYSSFKEDMAKMNERTYIKANGVKVCKVLAKQLSLNITEDELRSPKPPKPQENMWELYFHNGIPENFKSIASTDSLLNQPLTPDDDEHHAAHCDTTSNTEAKDAKLARAVVDLDDGVQTFDSGFSSSSPTDGQSPSPKVRFHLPMTEEERAATGELVEDPFRVAGISSGLSKKCLSNLSQLTNGQTHINSGLYKNQSPTTKDIKQEAVDMAFSHQLAASSTCKGQSLHNTSSQQQFPLNELDVKFDDVSVAFRNGQGLSGEMSSSLKTTINQLTSQIMGHQMDESAKHANNPYLSALNQLRNNKVAEPPACGCTNKPYDENTDGPYYVHLGAGPTVAAIRKMMENRTGLCGSALRFEKIRFTTKEGRTSLGCPAAKWIIRRSGAEEKVLVIAKHRHGHICDTAWIVAAIVVWEGVPTPAATHMYDYLTRILPVYGFETERRCGTNQSRDCACQGWDLNRKGASYSFGCSWSVYYNGCKFARSQHPRRFKLRDPIFEGPVESKFHALVSHLAPLYKQIAPMSYAGAVRYEKVAGDCRLGFRTGRPFSGCTAVVDFCAHQHRDTHNMNNGCTVVVTLTKHRGLSKNEDEQLHALPMYVLDDTDEFGSREGIQQKITSGALEVLDRFTQEQRRRSKPYKRRLKGTEIYQSPKVKAAFLRSVQENLVNETHTSPLVNDSNIKVMRLETPKQNLFNTTQPNIEMMNNPTNSAPSGGHSLFIPNGLPVTSNIESRQHPTENVYSNPSVAHRPVLPNPSEACPADVLDEWDNSMPIPKPRPPSPEYDDPDGKEFHEENQHLFTDPNIGGVAIALSHGSVLFECAKRELHATTALKNPDRYNPTRISLVFYQHKRLNFKKHGFYEYLKAEEDRQRARKEAKAAGREYIPKGLKYKQKRQMESAARKGQLRFNSIKVLQGAIRKKPGRKLGWRKQLRFASYRYMWPQPVNHPAATTTTTVVTRWMKPECFVTGPYQKWISLHSSPSNVQPFSKPISELPAVDRQLSETQTDTNGSLNHKFNVAEPDLDIVPEFTHINT